MQSSSQTNKPTPNFLQDACPSCRPTTNVQALKGKCGESRMMYENNKTLCLSD